MKIVYGKQLNNEQTKRVQEIAEQCGITFDIARLLFYRKQDSVEKVKRFLNPSKAHFHNPLLLSGVREALESIKNAKLLNKNVFILGDYDADGVCASTILFNSLKEFGIQSLRVYVPERVEGYGLNLDTIERFNKEQSIDLLITVDCGISDYDKIEELKKRGIEVIVTDHHEPPELLPSCIKINPKIKGQDYPFDGLCGAGVAYKLSYALIGEKANEYLDFVALATVADSMDLVDENRDLVAEGLNIFNNPNKIRLCMKYMFGDNCKTVLAQTLAYVIAPRINAGGRMGDANCALKLFISKNPNEIFDLAVKLNQYNVERQVECDIIYKEAKEKIQKYSLHKRNVILVKDKNWKTGFIGIVAARLVEEFARPVIVFAGQDDYYKGSARSVDQINVYEAIMANKEHLIGYGGHAQAAGVSVEKEKFSAFERAINDFVKQEYQNVDVKPYINVEWDIEGEISKQFAKELELLEPFGVGNRSPLFSVSAHKIRANRIRDNSPHYTFRTNYLEMLNFNGEKDVETLNLPVHKKIIFEINRSTFKGKEYIKGYVRSVLPDYDNFDTLRLHAINNQLDSIGEEQGEYKLLDKNNLPPDNGTGTLYVISDPNNLKFYPQLINLEKCFGKVQSKGYVSQIIYAPKQIPEGYEKVIYLDKPLFVQNTDAKTYVVKDLIGFGFIEKLSTDRVDFAKAFNCLLSLKNKTFYDLIDFVKENAIDLSEENLLFALKVFTELKIFSIVDKRLVYDGDIKNSLTNSKVYSKIVLSKESYV